MSIDTFWSLTYWQKPGRQYAKDIFANKKRHIENPPSSSDIITAGCDD